MKVNIYRVLCVILLAAAFLFPVSSVAAQKVGNLYHTPIPSSPDGSGLSEAQIREAIFAGCRVKGWRPSALDDNRISAEIDVRTHWAQVTISYSDKDFSIVYRKR